MSVAIENHLRLHTVEQVATMTGFHVRQVLSWIEGGDLEAVNLAKKPQWRIRPTDLERFLQGRSSADQAKLRSVARRGGGGRASGVTRFF